MCSLIKINLVAPGAYDSIDATHTPAFSFGIKSDLNKPNNNPGNLISNQFQSIHIIYITNHDRFSVPMIQYIFTLGKNAYNEKSHSIFYYVQRRMTPRCDIRRSK